MCRGAADDPVAIVEAAEIVRVETIAEIRAQLYRPRRGRMPDAADDGAETVSVFPSGFHAELKLFDGHLRRLEDDVLGVVEFPVLCQDAAFGFEALVETGIGERCDDGEAWQIDARLYGELGGLEKNIGLILVEAEDKAAL